MLMLLSVSTVFAGAACAVPTGKIVCYSNGNCSELWQLIGQCQTGNCDLNDLLKALVGYCFDSSGSTVTPPTEQTEPVEPDVPVVPTEPIEPTEPVKPTEPDIPDAPTEPTVPQASEFRTAFENEVISLVNAERAKVGLPALSADSGAVEVAHIRAKEIVQSFSHTRPDGRSCFTAASDSGVSYRTAGENIAYGYATPQQVVSGWMNSEGHRKNILSSSFTKIGVGCYESSGVLYWSQFFIG